MIGRLFALSVLLLGISDSQILSMDQLVRNGDRIVFLGDSNTFAGNYVSDIDVLLKSSSRKVEVVNLGLPSETCCGLSEPDHPFPRPTVQERLDRVLAKTNPNVVVACYGMNDGIYHPFSQKRFLAYQEGVLKLVEKVRKCGAKLVLLTPPPFDPLPMKAKNKLVDKASGKFAWFLIYEDYDSVLEKYSNWILTLKGQVDAVVDIRTPILHFLDSQRQRDPKFTMSGDGVHFNATCHRQIAKALIKCLVPNEKLEVDESVVKLSQAKMEILRDAWLTETRHQRPGMKTGLALPEAMARGRKIDQQIQARLQR
ncbi:MAG: GDSL-type esterase/lipase family protein [Planctomycetota bacterium]|nr:GDSL-type esterase/lipase family protein [Planctomycetota bacterium]